MLKKPCLYFRDLLSNVKKKGLTPQIWDGGGVTKNFYNYFFLSSNLFLTVKEKKRANKA